MRFLDPVSLARLRALRLGLRRQAAEGRASGRHRSASRGFSRDFAQHRAYVPGDEAKALDWKVYARQDRYFVKEFRAETILQAQVLLDSSGSMGFSSGASPSKWELACRLSLAVSYLVTARGDAAGLALFDGGLRRAIPPDSSFQVLEEMDRALAEAAPGGETDLKKALGAAAARIRRRSLVVLVSDLLGEPEGVAEVVKVLRARRHELMVLQVLDPAERDFPYEGSLLLRDLEDGRRLPVEGEELARLYRREFAGLLKLYEASFHRAGASYGAFYAGQPWEEGLLRLLSRWG